MRVTPRVWIGIAIWVGYLIIIVSVTLLSGIPYPEIGTSADATWRGAVMDLAVAAVALVIVTTLLGWWRPALFEQQRSRHKWPIFVPIIMLAAAILNIFSTDWSQFDASFLLSLLALGVLVGFCEELMARGLVLTAFRAQLAEGWVWFLSSALFGLMHLANALLGAPLLSSLQQAGLAFASGTAFYIVRRVTGSLIWAMLLHGLWDVSVFAVGHAPATAPFGAFLAPIVGVLSLAVVYWVITGTHERTPAEKAATNIS
ncbi:MAG: lysostaphin resistance A-like protein [Microbacterium sp.]|uniref:CPBP family intramembrane glutamic endopeptidase n=1 Tax=Microbacterium sp. TaxID=51671 RepID=UPI003F7FEBDF